MIHFLSMVVIVGSGKRRNRNRNQPQKRQVSLAFMLENALKEVACFQDFYTELFDLTSQTNNPFAKSLLIETLYQNEAQNLEEPIAEAIHALVSRGSEEKFLDSYLMLLEVICSFSKEISVQNGQMFRAVNHIFKKHCDLLGLENLYQAVIELLPEETHLFSLETVEPSEGVKLKIIQGVMNVALAFKDLDKPELAKLPQKCALSNVTFKYLMRDVDIHAFSELVHQPFYTAPDAVNIFVKLRFDLMAYETMEPIRHNTLYLLYQYVKQGHVVFSSERLQARFLGNLRQSANHPTVDLSKLYPMPLQWSSIGLLHLRLREKLGITELFQSNKRLNTLKSVVLDEPIEAEREAHPNFNAIFSMFSGQPNFKKFVLSILLNHSNIDFGFEGEMLENAKVLSSYFAIQKQDIEVLFSEDNPEKLAFYKAIFTMLFLAEESNLVALTDICQAHMQLICIHETEQNHADFKWYDEILQGIKSFVDEHDEVLRTIFDTQCVEELYAKMPGLDIVESFLSELSDKNTAKHYIENQWSIPAIFKALELIKSRKDNAYKHYVLQIKEAFNLSQETDTFNNPLLKLLKMDIDRRCEALARPLNNAQPAPGRASGSQAVGNEELDRGEVLKVLDSLFDKLALDEEERKVKLQTIEGYLCQEEMPLAVDIIKYTLNGFSNKHDEVQLFSKLQVDEQICSLIRTTAYFNPEFSEKFWGVSRDFLEEIFEIYAVARGVFFRESPDAALLNRLPIDGLRIDTVKHATFHFPMTFMPVFDEIFAKIPAILCDKNMLYHSQTFDKTLELFNVLIRMMGMAAHAQTKDFDKQFARLMLSVHMYMVHYKSRFITTDFPRYLELFYGLIESQVTKNPLLDVLFTSMMSTYKEITKTQINSKFLSYIRQMYVRHDANTLVETAINLVGLAMSVTPNYNEQAVIDCVFRGIGGVFSVCNARTDLESEKYLAFLRILPFLSGISTHREGVATGVHLPYRIFFEPMFADFLLFRHGLLNEHEGFVDEAKLQQMQGIRFPFSRISLNLTNLFAPQVFLSNLRILCSGMVLDPSALPLYAQTIAFYLKAFESNAPHLMEFKQEESPFFFRVLENLKNKISKQFQGIEFYPENKLHGVGELNYQLRHQLGLTTFKSAPRLVDNFLLGRAVSAQFFVEQFNTPLSKEFSINQDWMKAYLKVFSPLFEDNWGSYLVIDRHKMDLLIEKLDELDSKNLAILLTTKFKALNYAESQSFYQLSRVFLNLVIETEALSERELDLTNTLLESSHNSELSEPAHNAAMVIKHECEVSYAFLKYIQGLLQDKTYFTHQNLPNAEILVAAMERLHNGAQKHLCLEVFIGLYTQAHEKKIIQPFFDKMLSKNESCFKYKIESASCEVGLATDRLIDLKTTEVKFTLTNREKRLVNRLSDNAEKARRKKQKTLEDEIRNKRERLKIKSTNFEHFVSLLGIPQNLPDGLYQDLMKFTQAVYDQPTILQEQSKKSEEPVNVKKQPKHNRVSQRSPVHAQVEQSKVQSEASFQTEEKKSESLEDILESVPENLDHNTLYNYLVVVLKKNINANISASAQEKLCTLFDAHLAERLCDAFSMQDKENNPLERNIPSFVARWRKFGHEIAYIKMRLMELENVLHDNLFLRTSINNHIQLGDGFYQVQSSPYKLTLSEINIETLLFDSLYQCIHDMKFHDFLSIFNDYLPTLHSKESDTLTLVKTFNLTVLSNLSNDNQADLDEILSQIYAAYPCEAIEQARRFIANPKSPFLVKHGVVILDGTIIALNTQQEFSFEKSNEAECLELLNAIGQFMHDLSDYKERLITRLRQCEPLRLLNLMYDNWEGSSIEAKYCLHSAFVLAFDAYLEGTLEQQIAEGGDHNSIYDCYIPDKSIFIKRAMQQYHLLMHALTTNHPCRIYGGALLNFILGCTISNRFDVDVLVPDLEHPDAILPLIERHDERQSEGTQELLPLIQKIHSNEKIPGLAQVFFMEGFPIDIQTQKNIASLKEEKFFSPLAGFSFQRDFDPSALPFEREEFEAYKRSLETRQCIFPNLSQSLSELETPNDWVILMALMAKNANRGMDFDPRFLEAFEKKSKEILDYQINQLSIDSQSLKFLRQKMVVIQKQQNQHPVISHWTEKLANVLRQRSGFFHQNHFFQCSEGHPVHGPEGATHCAPPFFNGGASTK